MTIFNLGSINADLLYRVPHLPAAGETVASAAFSRGLGGKGANMAVAAARAAARCVLIGAVGPDGGWAVERLLEYGVDTRHVARLEAVTGHAVILLDQSGENSIVIHPGANRALGAAQLSAALAEARPGDLFLCQNETSGVAEGVRMARAAGMRVVHAAAPFDAEAVRALLPSLDLLVLNAVEAAQLEAATGQAPAGLGVRDVIVTQGARGAVWHDGAGQRELTVPALPVTAVDSTGAGDTFTGYLVAGLDRGMPMEQALRLATKAAALMVTRLGTADVIPDLLEVQDPGF